MNRSATSLGILMASLLVVSPCGAQQTIYNVPSADVTPKGKLFLQHESQFRLWNPGRFTNQTEYAAYGIGWHTELDATICNISTPKADSVSLGIGAKTSLPLLQKRFPEREFKLTGGYLMPISLSGRGVGGWGYAHLSGRLPKLNTRLTAGVSAGTHHIFGRDSVSFIGGIEQPLTKRVSLIADWYSGTHASGLLITGASIALPKASALYLGYQTPNNKRSGRGGFVVELAKFF